jgi:hypothetical protein
VYYIFARSFADEKNWNSLKGEKDMPAKDIYHEAVKAALINDGWTITHDPLGLTFGRKNLYVDLGAERLIAAAKGEQKIAVEVKSFIGKSEVEDIENALGKYVFYLSILPEIEPDRKLFLAVTHETYEGIFNEPLGEFIMRKFNLNIIVFDETKEVIVKWIP